MRAYVVRRLLLIIPTLLLVTILVFMVVRFIPGDVITMMVTERARESAGVFMDEELTAEALRKALGMDVPFHVQYGRWLSDVVQGDLGDSLWGRTSITQRLSEKLPISFELGLLSMAIALAIALPIGVYSAIRQYSWTDYLGRTIAVLAISLPSFWIATMVIVYPAIWWNWAPSMEYIPFVEDPGGNLLQFILPAAIMGMVMSGTTMRMTRTMMLEVLRQDYIRTAWSKGLRERAVVVRHALKNALMPVVTIVGMMVPIMIGGSVILEQIFALPGVGRWVLEAINTRDYPVISGINLVIATVVLACNLLVDLTYAWMDPRIRYR
jgi:peptide/nickel transport system permease protein